MVLKEGMKRLNSKDATKADLDVGIHGHEEVQDKGKDGEVVTSHTQRGLILQESESPSTISQRFKAKSEFGTNTILLRFTRCNTWRNYGRGAAGW